MFTLYILPGGVESPTHRTLEREVRDATGGITTLHAPIRPPSPQHLLPWSDRGVLAVRNRDVTSRDDRPDPAVTSPPGERQRAHVTWRHSSMADVSGCGVLARQTTTPHFDFGCDPSRWSLLQRGRKFKCKCKCTSVKLVTWLRCYDGDDCSSERQSPEVELDPTFAKST